MCYTVIEKEGWREGGIQQQSNLRRKKKVMIKPGTGANLICDDPILALCARAMNAFSQLALSVLQKKKRRENDETNLVFFLNIFL